MLDVEDIEAERTGIKVLFGVSLSVEENEIVSVIGSNGAGKSTLMKTISGLLRPASGSITLNNKRIDGLEPREICKEGLIQVPEGQKIFPLMSVKENLQLGAYLPEAREELEESLEKVYDIFPRLKEREGQWVETLSGGEQQMLAMGRALMGRPELLILDEPTLGLAPKLVDEVFSMINTINEGEVTILLSSQEVRKSLNISSRAYVMENGKFVMEGESDEMMENPEIKESYFGR